MVMMIRTLLLAVILLTCSSAFAQPAAPTSMTLFPVATTVQVSTGYDSAATSIVLTAGHGARLSTFPDNYYVHWWNSTDYTYAEDDPNREVVKITDIATDTLTVERGQVGTSAVAHNTGGKTYKMTSFSGTFGSNGTWLQFTDNATNELGFKIERKIGAGSFVEIVELGPSAGPTVNFFDKTGEMAAGSSVTYRARAFNGGGNSAYTNEPSQLVTASRKLPAAPTSVTATWGTTGVTVSWSHADIGAWVCCGAAFTNTQFQVWRSESSSGPFEEIGGALNNGSFLDRRWEFSKTYYYKVRGWHYNGWGNFSSVTSSVTTASPSTPVAAITADSTVLAGETYKVSGSSSTYTNDLPMWTGIEMIYPYSWDFGTDEDTGYNMREAMYTYRTPGVKTITLTTYAPLTTTHRTVTDGVTNNTTTLTSATASFTSGDVGRKVRLYGGSSTTTFLGTIASFTNSTTVTLSGNPGTTATGVSVLIAAAIPASDTETHNVTVSDIQVTSDTVHNCTVGESGGSVSARHQPDNFAELQAAVDASVGQDHPLIEITTGNTDYTAPSATALLLKAQRTGAGYCTIRPLNYSTNFTNQKRVTSADVANLGKINMPAVNTYDDIVRVEGHATDPADHYRLQGIEVRKTTATQTVAINAGFSLFPSGGPGPTAPWTPMPLSQMPHHFILQHCYLDGDPKESHWAYGVSSASRQVSVLDSRMVNIKRNGFESYGIYLFGPEVIIDNNELYGFSMAVFLTGEESGFSINGIQRHVTTRRNYLTRRLADRTETYFTSGSFNWKNIFEVKRGEFIMLTRNVIGPSWNGAQDGTPILFTPANQTCDSMYTQIHHTQTKDNVVRSNNASGGSGTWIDLYARDGSCGGFADMSSHHLITNNLFFDGVGGDYPQIYMFVGADVGEFVQWLISEHNTIQTTEDQYSFGNGEWVPPITTKVYLFSVNNLHLSGYIRGATSGSWNKVALDMYAKTYSYMGNAVDSGVGGHSDWAGIDPTNKFPADVATIAWTDYTNRDLRLSGSSPYRAAGSDPATDGLDRGANLTTLLTKLGGSSYAFGVGTTKAETGDWTGVASTEGGSRTKGKVQTKGKIKIQ